jgi:hypothetical protein
MDETGIMDTMIGSRLKRLIIFSLFLFSISYSQPDLPVQFLPASKFVQVFSADEHAHQMKVQNLLFTKNLICSLGGVFPVADISLFDVKTQISFGATAHLQLQPRGQSNLVNTDFYVDYFIADLHLSKGYFLRLLAGHTSHHLSDQWYDALQMPKAFHYSRDYVELDGIYNLPNNISFLIGGNYGYHFHLLGMEQKRWMFHCGGEKEIIHISESVRCFIAADIKVKQEANFASSNAYQIGIKMPMGTSRLLRFAYEFRHGIDESGQFFLQRVSRHSIGLYIEV